MIQMQLGTTGIIVLEPENIDRVKSGQFLRLPVEYFRPPLDSLILDYTPDLEWCQERLSELLTRNENPHPKEMQAVIRESRNRAEVRGRPAHPVINMLNPKVDA